MNNTIESTRARESAPIVHINGNSKESLINEWTNFFKVLDQAKEAFPNQSFHSRNYYPIQGRFEVATELGKEMTTTLKELQELCCFMINEIDKQ